MSNNYVMEYSYLENEQYEMLQDHYLEMIERLKNQSTVINTGNLGIDSIVNYKIAMAKENGICVKQELKMGGDVTVCNEELNILLGNLFDNAIDAVKGLSEEKRKIKFVLRVDKTVLYVETRNCYEGERNKLSEATYATTKEDKKNHGFGMKSMKEIIKSHNGTLKITDHNQEFIIKIMIYM